jgi:hypothetical protein
MDGHPPSGSAVRPPPGAAPPPLRWTLPGGVELAYSAAADGDMRDPGRRDAWLARLGLRRWCVVPRQVHGTRVVDAAADFVALIEADGVVAAGTPAAVGAYGADCPALVLASAQALGIAHCGWRGTAGGIVANLVAAVAACSAEPRARWRAFIGPGISGPCYEVDAPVLGARAWPAEALAPGRPGRAHLDVPAAVAADLRALGIDDVRVSGVCTASDPRLWSYRRRGPGQVQLLAAWRE